jgi:hypothetical protein
MRSIQALSTGLSEKSSGIIIQQRGPGGTDFTESLLSVTGFLDSPVFLKKEAVFLKAEAKTER